MLAEALRTLYGYTAWANGRVLNVASLLTPEQLYSPGVAGHGSVRDTLVHMIDTHRGWPAWWDGSMDATAAYNFKADPSDYPDVVAIRSLWESVDRSTQEFVSGLTDEDAVRSYVYTLPGGAESSMILWHMMLHVANHGTQHRSEVAAMLTGFGHSPGDLDLLYYNMQRQAG